MKPFCRQNIRPSHFLVIIGFIVFCIQSSPAQKNAIVQVHADKTSGYGVAYGGPQNLGDRIVTALHVVAGKKTIVVKWQGKTANAQIEKIYKPADLALLKLNTSLGIPPLALYSGEPPFETNINFWEIPVNTSTVTAKTTILEDRTSLSGISPRVANNPAGLSKSLCMDAGQFYPGMSTQVLNFKEPNIRKAHSGSPLTFDGKILGMIDGGARLTDGKACVWAIPASDFTKLFTQGTAPASTLQTCGGAAGENKFMYSGIRSDNPLLTEEEAMQAREIETPVNFNANDGSPLGLYHEYRMDYADVYETLFEDEQNDITEIFESEDGISMDDLLAIPVDLYVEEMTGVSIMVPAQSELSVSKDEFGTGVITTSPGGSVTMVVYISPGLSMEDGMNTMEAFKSAMEEEGFSMQPEEDEILDLIHDPYTPYYSEYIHHSADDQDGDNLQEYFFDLQINDGDFMAVSVIVNDWSELENNPKERLFLYLLETCALLSDFSIY